MAHTNDPLAILGDLEVDLILSSLSIPEIIVIRGVSTLWKARVDYRLTSGAIRRHYPTAEEAQTIYPTKHEEALAFRRVAHRHGTREEPSLALVFRNPSDKEIWCLTDDLIIRTGSHRGCLHIQRVYDPKNPHQKHFKVKNMILQNVPLKGKPRNGQPLRVQWMTGDDASGIIVLHVGVDDPYGDGPERISHPRWNFAINLANGQVIWCHKAPMTADSHRWGGGVPSRDPPVSLGHGNACIVDLSGNLTILDLTTGQQKACAHIPDHRYASFSTLRGQSQSYNLTAHPTMQLCFAITERALSIFSTETAQVIKTVDFIDYLPRQRWAWTKLHFGKRPDKDGGGQRAWLLCDAWNFSGQIWMHGPTAAEAIVSYEIDLEKLELVQVALWKIAHHGSRLWTTENSQSLLRDDVEGLPTDFSGVHLRFLNPVTGIGYICVGKSCYHRDPQFQIWVVSFKQTGVRIPAYPPSNPPPITYEVEGHRYLTLPEKIHKMRGGNLEPTANNTEIGESSSRSRRREFIFKKPPSILGSHFSGRYIAFTAGREFYLFGFMPRW